MTLPFFQALLAETYLRLRDWGEARALLEKALADVDRTGLRQWESELHRLRAEVALMASDDGFDEAEACCRRGLDLARRQEARSLELRIAVPLTRLLAARGRTEEARDLLATVYGWFTEGFDTDDLKDAKVLLDELA